MALTDLENLGLRSLFKDNIKSVEAKIAAKNQLLEDNPNQHEVWKQNLSYEIRELRGGLSAYTHSLQMLQSYGIA